MNRFAYFSRDIEQTVQYVRNILTFITDIRDVEIFQPRSSPYVEVIQDGHPTRRQVFYNRKDYKYAAKNTSLGQQIQNLQVYTFMMRDDIHNEVWLYVNPKKVETHEILHMVGLKDIKDFQNKPIFSARKLVPNHDLNVLVEGEGEKRILFAKYRFPYACKRLKAVELLHSYGFLNPILTKHDYGEDIQYFCDVPLRNNETYDYATNNIFSFHEDGVPYDEVVDILEFIAKETNGDVELTKITS